MRQRDKIILSVIGAVVLFGGFWTLVLSPKLDESKKLEQEIVKTRKAIKTADKVTHKTEQVNVNYSKTYATLAKLGKAVPEAGSVDDDVPSLLLQLNQGGKVTKTGLASVEVSEDLNGGGGGAQTPSQQGSTPAAGAPAAGAAAAGASGASGADGAAAAAATLNEVTYKYSYVGDLYDLEDMMNYVTNLVRVDGSRLKISGRLIEVRKIEFSILSADETNPLLKTDVDVVTYTTPEGESITSGGGDAATGAGAAPAATGASSGSGASSSDNVPGAPPQAQPATPPSATVRRP